jgi:hypothetical protein
MSIGVGELGIYGLGFSLIRGMAWAGRFGKAWRMSSTAEYHFD